MTAHQAALRYCSYLLRFWQERRGSYGGSAVWRFSLDDPHSGERQGFATLEELVAALTRAIEDPAKTEPGTSRVRATTRTVRLQEDSMPQDGRVEAEAAIRGLVDHVEEGWNRGDGAAFAAPFADDADYVVIDGRHVKSRQAIADGHQQIFDTIYKGSHNTATVRSIRFLREDVAIAHITWHLVVPQGGTIREGRAFNTMVLARDDDRWRISAFQNTPIVAPTNGLNQEQDH